MGMALGGAGGKGGRRRRGSKRGPMAEINVTPMVDVMLVLLIIFMVAAPMMTVGVPIDMPETSAKPLNSDTQPITISVKPTGEIFIQETAITLEELVPKLQAIAKTGYSERVLVRGDVNANYGSVIKVMAQISAAGYKNMGLITLPDNAK